MSIGQYAQKRASGMTKCIVKVLPPALSQARPWPEKPITVILPATAGAASDDLTRTVVQQMAKSIDQPYDYSLS